MTAGIYSWSRHEIHLLSDQLINMEDSERWSILSLIPLTLDSKLPTSTGPCKATIIHFACPPWCHTISFSGIHFLQESIKTILQQQYYKYQDSHPWRYIQSHLSTHQCRAIQHQWYYITLELSLALSEHHWITCTECTPTRLSYFGNRNTWSSPSHLWKYIWALVGIHESKLYARLDHRAHRCHHPGAPSTQISLPHLADDIFAATSQLTFGTNQSCTTAISQIHHGNPSIKSLSLYYDTSKSHSHGMHIPWQMQSNSHKFSIITLAIATLDLITYIIHYPPNHTFYKIPRESNSSHHLSGKSTITNVTISSQLHSHYINIILIKYQIILSNITPGRHMPQSKI